MPPNADALAAVAQLPGVAASTQAARSAVDALLWRRDVRAAAGAVAADSVERGARSSAAIDGADVVVVDASPMGRVLDSALRLTAAIPVHVDEFGRTPLQALAALHVLTATGFVESETLGRPRATDVVDDPLNLGGVVPAAEVSDRMMTLASVLTTPTDAPAIVVAAIAHAEIAVVRPFGWGSGLLSRAVTRLVLASRGVDPSLFSIPEHGMAELGRTSYVRALRGYAAGTSDGVADFIDWHATAITIGAEAVTVP